MVKVKEDLSRLESHYQHEHEIHSNVSLLSSLNFLDQKELDNLSRDVIPRVTSFFQTGHINPQIGGELLKGSKHTDLLNKINMNEDVSSSNTNRDTNKNSKGIVNENPIRLHQDHQNNEVLLKYQDSTDVTEIDNEVTVADFTNECDIDMEKKSAPEPMLEVGAVKRVGRKKIIDHD